MRRRGARRKDGRLRRRLAARGRERGGGDPARGGARLRAARLGSLARRPPRRRLARRVHSWGYDTGDLHPLRGPIELPRARVIGGCSAHNGCIVAVGCRRTTTAGRGARRRERDLGRRRATAATSRARSSGYRVRHYAEEEIGPFHRACLDAAAALGLPRADDLDDLDGGVGFGSEPVNVDGGVRMSTPRSRTSTRRAAGRTSAWSTARSATVSRRTTKGSRPLRGATARSCASRRARPSLAAGAYRSPAILLRSSVGESEVLGPHGIPTSTRCRASAGTSTTTRSSSSTSGSDRLPNTLAYAGAAGFVPEEQTLGKLPVEPRRSGAYDLHLIPVAAPGAACSPAARFSPIGAVKPRFFHGRLRLAAPIRHGSRDRHGYSPTPGCLGPRRGRRRRGTRGDGAAAR